MSIENEAGLDVDSLRAEVEAGLSSIEGKAADSEEIHWVELAFHEFDTFRESPAKRANFLCDKFLEVEGRDYQLAHILICSELAFLSSEEGDYSVAHDLLGKANEAAKKFEMPFSSIVRSRVRVLQAQLSFNEFNKGKPVDHAMTPLDQAASHARKALEEGDPEIVEKPFIRMILANALRLRSYAYLQLGKIDKAMQADADERKFKFLGESELERRELSIASAYLRSSQQLDVSEPKAEAEMAEAVKRAELVTSSENLQLCFGGFAVRSKVSKILNGRGIPTEEVDHRSVVENAALRSGKDFGEVAELYVTTFGRYGFRASDLEELRAILKRA